MAGGTFHKNMAHNGKRFAWVVNGVLISSWQFQMTEWRISLMKRAYESARQNKPSYPDLTPSQNLSLTKVRQAVDVINITT